MDTLSAPDLLGQWVGGFNQEGTWRLLGEHHSGRALSAKRVNDVERRVCQGCSSAADETDLKQALPSIL